VQLYNSWKEAPQVPKDWKPADPPGGLVKVPVRNRQLLAALRHVLPGKWVKMYRYGKDGTEVHYFEHSSGKVFNVKHKVK